LFELIAAWFRSPEMDRGQIIPLFNLLDVVRARMATRKKFDIKRYPDWLQKSWDSMLHYMLTVALPEEGSMEALLKDFRADIYNGNDYATQIRAIALLDWAQTHYPAAHRAATGLDHHADYVVDISKRTARRPRKTTRASK
jgi:hypothetical protein